MSVATAIRKFGERLGLESDEIEAMLADEQPDDSWRPPELDLSESLLGEATDAFELFIPDVGPALAEKDSTDGLVWAPMIRAGQWAVRPGPRGQKKRKPLKVVAGYSEDPRKQIGLKDLLDGFDDGAVEYVTVPESHDNRPLENTGFIRKMKIAVAPIQTGPNKGKKAPTLFGGYHFTDKKAKQKVTEGSVAGRSCGILYDYTNTETGKTYKSVIEHCCLTNKPWITGMIPFGRKLAGVEGLSQEAAFLSDEEPPEDFFENDTALSTWVDSLELAAVADATVEEENAWSKEESPSWLQSQVNQLLDKARQEKLQQRRSANKTDYVYESVPYYRCREAKPGEALIADGYGDDANFWSAGIKIVDGSVQLDDFSTWKALKKAYIPDQRKPPAKKDEPLDQRSSEADKTPRGRLALAQARRQRRNSTESAGNGRDSNTTTQPTHPRGGEQHMSDDNGGAVAQLSEEAQRRIEEAERRAREAEERATSLSEQVGRLVGDSHKTKVGSFLDRLKGMGLDEEHGFGGFLTELENVLNSDDGGVAVVSEAFSQDGHTEVELSLTESFERVFDAIQTGEDGKVKLGEQLAQPTDQPGAGEKEDEGGTNASADGKPPAGDEDETKLSADAKADRAVAENPQLAAIAGPPKAKAAENGKGGDAS